MVDLEELLQSLVELQTNELGSSWLGALLGLGSRSSGTLGRGEVRVGGNQNI